MDKMKCITFNSEVQNALPDDVKSKMKADREKAEFEKNKREIDELSHMGMCRIWRFGGGKPEWFDSTNPLSKYFKERLFDHFGGFTPEISKILGWKY